MFAYLFSDLNLDYDIWNESIEVELLKHSFIWAFSSELVRSIVWLPRWLEFDVIVHLLMSDKHLFITPFGSNHGTLKLEGTDKNSLSTNLWWCSPSVNIIEIGVSWNWFELIQIVHCVRWLSVTESCSNLSRWGEVNSPWEDWSSDFLSCLVKFSHVTETNFLDPVSSSRELVWNSCEGSSTCSFNMVLELMCKEIPFSWLSINGIHSNQVGWIDSISQEFESHAWSKWRFCSQFWFSSWWKSDNTLCSTFENTSERVSSSGD